MKKLITSLLALIAVVAVALCFNDATVTAKAEDPHVHCICGENCDAATAENGHTCTDVEWIPISSATDWDNLIRTPVKTPGTEDNWHVIHAYLTADISLSNQVTCYGYVRLDLCLNGHTITRKVASDSLKLFLIGNNGGPNKLNFCDCQGTGKIAYASGKTHGDNFSFIQVVASGGKHEINLFGGTLGQATIFYRKNGSSGAPGSLSYGALSLSNGSVLNVYGGTWNGAICTSDEANGYKNNCKGGFVQVLSGATMNMYGGTIQNGEAFSGGNIYNSGTFNLYGGTIKNGKAATVAATSTTNPIGGGNVFSASGSKFNMYGGSILDGQLQGLLLTDKAYAYGGNLRTEGTAVISGGVISGGKVNTDPNAKTFSSGGNLYIKGTCTVKGTAVIKDGECRNGGGNISNAGKLNVEGGVIENGYAWANGGNIFMDTGSSCVVNISGGEIRNGKSRSGGNIYSQSKNVTAPGCINMTGGKLYGGKAVLESTSTSSGAYGGNIYIKSGVATFAGGEVYDGKCINEKTGSNTLQGGNFFVYDEATIYVKDTAKIYSTLTENCANDGGIFHVEKGTLEISGGDIYGGIAKNGGNINLTTSGTLNISGGVIRDGVASSYGGNIRVVADSSVLNLTGGTIKDGLATGGNIYLSSGTANLLDGTISGGKTRANGSGGNLYINGKYTDDAYTANVTLDGATITGGQAFKSETGSGGHGANVLISVGKLTMESGTISNGVAEEGGAGGDNIAMIGNSTLGDGASVFIMNGGTISGGANTIGGVRSWRDQNVIEIHGGSISHSEIAVSALDNTTLIIDNDAAEISSEKTAVNINMKAPTCAITGGKFKGALTGDVKHVISGGYFELEPAADYLVIPYVAVEDDTYAGYYYTIDLGILVSAVGESETTGTSVAMVTGGGVYAKGASFTLTAPHISNGYTFSGWFTKSGELLSKELSYTKADGAQADFEAVAIYTKGADKVVLTVRTTEYTVQLTTPEFVKLVSANSETTYELAPGSSVEFAEDGGATKYFMNESGKILTRSSEYSFDIYTDSTIVCVSERGFEGAAADLFTVVFLNDKGQVLKTLAVSEAITEADLPVIPIRVGKTDGKWDKTLDEINASIEAKTALTEVSATYTEVESIYTALTGVVTPTVQMTLTQVTEQPDGKFTLSFGATRSVPTGYTMVEQGLLLGTDASISNPMYAESTLVFDSITAVKYRSSGYLADDITVLNMKNVTAGRLVYARGYVVYTTGDSTETEVAYTDVYIGSTLGISTLSIEE